MNDLTPLSDPQPPVIRGIAAQTWQELLAELHTEYVPDDFFTRTWLRDIAILTRRIDELRLIQSGLHARQLYALAYAADGGGSGGQGAAGDSDTGSGTGTESEMNGTAALWTHDPDELVAIRVLVAPLLGLDTLTLPDISPALMRILGLSYEQRVDIFSIVQSQISNLMIERDRVAERYREWEEKKNQQAEPQITPEEIMHMLAPAARMNGNGTHDDE